MEDISKNYLHIKGWGIDADPRNEPTYPMKNYTGDDHRRSNWKRPPQQDVDIEILKSNERPALSAVIGTSVPPSGLSGIIRRFAFKYSESSYGHWLPLLLADRVNMVEGILQDIGHGHIPNVFAEMGWKYDLKHNPKRLAKKVAAGVVLTAAVATFFYVKKKRKQMR